MIGMTAMEQRVLKSSGRTLSSGMTRPLIRYWERLTDAFGYEDEDDDRQQNR